MNKTAGPEGAHSLVRETESPSLSDHVASASKGYARELVGTQRRGPHLDGDSGRPSGGGGSDLTLKEEKDSVKRKGLPGRWTA